MNTEAFLIQVDGDEIKIELGKIILNGQKKRFEKQFIKIYGASATSLLAINAVADTLDSWKDIECDWEFILNFHIEGNTLYAFIDYF